MSDKKKTACACPFCGGATDADDSICSPCSVKIDTCPDCGRPLPRGAVTCPECAAGKDR